MLVAAGHGTMHQVGWEMSVAEVNHFLHALLVQKGLVCDWVDARASEATRTAERARERLERWRKH